MLKKLGMLAAVTAIAGVAFAAFAPAANAAPPRPDVVLAGRGVLDAHGTGVAAVKGLIDYHATADEGILLVKDIKGDARIDVQGNGETANWHGFTVYFGFHGEASIQGTDVAVIAVGRGIDLHVFGRGWAYLKGNGEFRVNGGDAHPWTDEGAFAGISTPLPAPAP